MQPSVRVGIAGAALAVWWAAPIGSQTRPFAYGPGSYHYAVTTTVDRSQDQPAGRPPFAFQVVTRQQVTLDLAAAGPDTLDLTITIDSITVGSSLAAPEPDLGKVRGAKLAGKMSPAGRIYVFEAPAGTAPETAALYNAFRRFLIALPPRAVAVGNKWTDTTMDTVTKEGVAVTTRTITTSRVAGDTTISGERAWRIVRSSVIEARGTGSEAGQPLRLQNNGTITGTHFISRRGVYLGSASTQRVELLLSVSAADASMPIVQTITSNVALLPGHR